MTTPRKPTPLDAYLECLHILRELPAKDRLAVIRALSKFKYHCEDVLTSPRSDESEPEQ